MSSFRFVMYSIWQPLWDLCECQTEFGDIVNIIEVSFGGFVMNMAQLGHLAEVYFTDTLCHHRNKEQSGY